jgi:biotin carboxylase
MNRNLLLVESPDFFIDDLARIARAEGDRIHLVTKEGRHRDVNVIRADVRDDPAAAVTAVRDAVGRPDGILTAQEMFLTETAALAAALGVAHADPAVAARARDKVSMKQIWTAAGVATPRGWDFASARQVRDSIDDFTYPLILKPSHGYASCGVRKVENREELLKHLRDISLLNATVISREHAAAGIVVEEYLDGEEFSIDTVWFDGEPLCDGIMSKGTAVGPYYPDRLYRIDPALEPALARRITQLSHDAVRALGIRSGATHTEVRLRDGVPHVLESTNRPGAGGLFYPLFQQAHGVDFTRTLYHAAVSTTRDQLTAGIGTCQASRPDPGAHYFWYNIPAQQVGIIREIRGLDHLAGRPEVLRCICYKQAGGVLYAEGLNADYFCSVLGCYRPDPAEPSITDFVRAYDDMLEVVL